MQIRKKIFRDHLANADYKEHIEAVSEVLPEFGETVALKGDKVGLTKVLEHKSILSQDFDLVMASFDVESHFTNVPVDETIDFILETIFVNDDDVFQGFSKVDFKKLLELAVRDTAFVFNDEVYVQVDGVGMGNPLSCTFADIFMFKFEQELLDNCPASFKPLFYRRYVDDTFRLFRDHHHCDLFLEYANASH
ncbi:uncharacterized protein LOC135217568 [Macrobrachium nipponense]|uniref:uncharacterized protein LOC135217568 n=1 Tax=Macrobrachium nipponense TaxID=159736 RepID=UPI0030C8CAB3